MPDEPELVARALTWLWRAQERVCDQIEPWEHGTAYRASRYPGYFGLNVVRVVDDPGLGVEEIIRFADLALAGLDHRDIQFDSAAAAAAASLRSGFEARGFRTTRLVLMHYEGAPRGRTAPDVIEVPYDAVNELRSTWHREDFPGSDDSEYQAQAREVRLALGTRTLALYDGSRAVAFAGLDLGDDEVELGALYVLPEHRGRGLGTALAGAAISAAGGVEHLWICADEEDRPKQLYTRLGFQPVLTTTQFLRLPPPASAP